MAEVNEEEGVRERERVRESGMQCESHVVMRI